MFFITLESFMLITQGNVSSASTDLLRSALIDDHRLSGDFGGIRPSGLTTLAFGRRDPRIPLLSQLQSRLSVSYTHLTLPTKRIV